MTAPEMLALPCPSCKADIYRPLPWFRRTFNTCPHCGGGLAASQFAELVEAAEQAFDARIEELFGEPAAGCGGCRCQPPSPREVGGDD